MPSRASILTGQYSHKNGVKTLKEALDTATDNVAKRLQQAGYQTSLVGKWHLKSEPGGFDYWNVIKRQGRYHNPILFEMDLDKPVVEPGTYCTDLFTDKALSWLDRRDREKPFCLMLHFKATHEAWNFHPRHAKLYEDVTLPEPATLFGSTGPEGTHVPGWPLEILTDRMVRGGHGDGKLVLDDIILNIDFAESFLDYAGADPPPSMQGRSFRANLAGRTPVDWRQAMYYRYYAGDERRPAHFGIRTHDAKLIYYDGLTNRPEQDRWEFYDLKTDPRETRNRYGDPGNAQPIESLNRQLAKLQAELGDRP